MNAKKSKGMGGVTFCLFLIMILAVFWLTNQAQTRQREITYTDFQKLVEDNRVEAVRIRQNKAVPTGSMDIFLKKTDEERRMYVSDVNEIQAYLNEEGIIYELKDVPQDSWLLTTIFPNIQFIVSTHSPFILNSIPETVIYDLENHTLVEKGLADIPYGGIVEGYFRSSEMSKTLEE